MKTNFKQLSEKEIFRFIEGLGQRPYRAGQIIDWIYRKLAVSIDEMTDISKDLRDCLKARAFISNLNILKTRESGDGTRKFLFGLEDGETIESVLIPNNREKFTLCISSQAGCAMGCGFCMTGRQGLKRNLRAYEIIDQVIAVKRYIRRGSLKSAPSIANIVFMGMGEPLNNFDEVVRALRTFTDVMGFSRRKITVSTAGIIPRIAELADKAPGINLAISLNATTDRIRDSIMPVNKKYPLNKLLDACREFPLSPNRRITFQYVLLDKINDSKEDAARLVQLLKGIRSKVNLIPYNPSGELVMDQSPEPATPAESGILEFQKILHQAKIVATIRKSKGADISAACGQLRAGYL